MNKVPVFAAGILLGVGATAITVYVLNNSSVKPIVKSTPDVQTVSSRSSTERTDTGSHTASTERSKPEYVRTKSDSDYFPNIDNNSALYDSLFAEQSKQEMEVFDNGEVIRTDRMVAVKRIAVNDKTTEKSINAVDSVLNEANNMKEDQAAKNYEVEFWRSALNSRGYRMGKQKIALYGIDPQDQIALFRLEEGVFLRSGSHLYKLEVSPEFRAFRQVNDKKILKEIEF